MLHCPTGLFPPETRVLTGSPASLYVILFNLSSFKALDGILIFHFFFTLLFIFGYVIVSKKNVCPFLSMSSCLSQKVEKLKMHIKQTSQEVKVQRKSGLLKEVVINKSAFKFFFIYILYFFFSFANMI